MYLYRMVVVLEFASTVVVFKCTCLQFFFGTFECTDKCFDDFLHKFALFLVVRYYNTVAAFPHPLGTQILKCSSSL